MYKKIFKDVIILITFLCLISLIAGCSRQSKQKQVQNDFEVYLNDLFIQEVQSDTLSLNYSLAYPEKYGIEEKQATFGEYGISSMNDDLFDAENNLSRLLSYDSSLLSSDQQLTYNVVSNYLEQSLKFGDFMYYPECLGPTTGVQAQLPILLAEYSFYDREDIDEYLELLTCIDVYFKDIIQYEREKSDYGLFMSDNVVKRIIEQCSAFIESPKDNFLIQYFDERISVYEGLTEEEISYYKALNREAILCHVIPAYKELITALTELMGSSTNNAGLYYYPEGQAYYECLAQYKTGSDKSMEEIIQMLNGAINSSIADITTLTQSDPTLVDKYLSFSSFPLTDPNDILSDLKTDIIKDFPSAIPVNCDIKYVPDSLSEYLSPAMYLVPPLDSYNNNNIYINGNNKETLSMIYTTVAHEGYPGHLYQCVYFRNKHPEPIRSVLNFVGYDEGWATYVEMYSYHLSGIDENLADFLEANNVVILCMYARADIGIHYEGWTKSDVVSYVTKYFGDEEIAGLIYDTLLEEPAIYLPYAVGYLEIVQLREKAEQALGSNFVAKDFNQFLLDIGPSQYAIIDDYLDSWISSKK